MCRHERTESNVKESGNKIDLLFDRSLKLGPGKMVMIKKNEMQLI